MDIQSLRSEIKEYTEGALLPFWIQRTVDQKQGGFITHFDEFGEDAGDDEGDGSAWSSVFTGQHVGR
jgi:mannobiose 2-epimerase